MATPHWKGSRGVHEMADSPEIDTSSDQISITRKYEGPYNAVKAARPELASVMDGFPDVYVLSHRLTRASGDRGRLTVKAYISRPGANSGPGANGPAPLADPVIEIDWVRISKPIENHPKFAALGDDAIRAIKDAVQNPKKDKLPDIGESAPAQKLYERLLRGQDSYDVWAPVVKATTEHNGRPDTGRCGVISDPPQEPSGTYAYLKTGDNARRQNRRWTRVQEWTGADKIDAYIYAAPVAATS